MNTLNEHVKNLEVTIAVLTVPSQYAQSTANRIVRAGIKAIWNFTNEKLNLPQEIVSQQEDLTSGYALLCVKMDSRKPKLIKE